MQADALRKLLKQDLTDTLIRVFLIALLVVASMGFLGSAIAGDEWFVLGEQAMPSANPSGTIKSEGGRWDKDVKQVKVSVEAPT